MSVKAGGGKPDTTGLLGKELAEMKIANIQKEMIINQLGTELALLKIKVITLEARTGTPE
jgi:hypothetical protein